MSELALFSFALSPRMQSFLQLRDGLRALQSAEGSPLIYHWFQACVDLKASLLGESGRKMAISELTSLLVSMRTELESLAEEHQQFRSTILQSCNEMDRHVNTLRDSRDVFSRLFSGDHLLDAYVNATKKQDWLAHKMALPQMSERFRSNNQDYCRQLLDALQPLIEIVAHLNNKLHDHVGWQQSVAEGGHEQIRLDRAKTCGLLIVGMEHEYVARGLIPEISGNHLAIRIRFQRMVLGKSIEQATTHVPYHFMAVPVA
ncbi:MAG: hypothetical protein R8M38_01885 [Mariprofundaceae bacterium]